jgi:hypothetical protein
LNRVGPAELVTGVKRDFKMDITLDEAQEIIDRYSGNLTLGNFMKMVGAGADGAKAKAANARPELTEDEKTLLHLARQAKGKSWQRIFDSARDVDQIVPGLRMLSIYVLGPDLRACFAKFGKKGVVDRIEEFIASL